MVLITSLSSKRNPDIVKVVTEPPTDIGIQLIDNTLSITFKYKVNVKGLFTYLETSFYPPSLSLLFFILCFKAICFGFFVSLNRLTESLLLAVHHLLPHQIQVTGNLKQLRQKKRLFVLFVIVLKFS